MDIGAVTREQNLQLKSDADAWENASVCATVETAPRPRWERVMYKSQPYPPNYVSDDFLRGINENETNSYTLMDIWPKTMMLTQHCSTMVIMARMFILIKDGVIPIE
ncbi:uncharacterized protein BXIN_2878 [Babesia sp. Xinjiang]|uniref:uncharacterized protein n=1 Tax=Babesia sp. Xinjiang TaxID=462227 RepID=UPI000A22A732|nr:uncharacterized protein BXIN_2878 [Babesia sp. Xinjiang]ORM39583.1 hypothetical protein BXIN_2878 [Babesia sp. Xinjiang]